MKDRIKQLMERQKMSQQTFADILGISPASLSSIFNDRTKPTLNHVEAIKRKFPTINLEWLLSGNGSMFTDDDPNNSQISSSSTPSLNGSMIDFEGDTNTHTDIENKGYEAGTRTYNGAIPTKTEIKYIERPQRKITEIRIFFDDQTWETFIPQK